MFNYVKKNSKRIFSMLLLIFIGIAPLVAGSALAGTAVPDKKPASQ